MNGSHVETMSLFSRHNLLPYIALISTTLADIEAWTVATDDPRLADRRYWGTKEAAYYQRPPTVLVHPNSPLAVWCFPSGSRGPCGDVSHMAVFLVGAHPKQTAVKAVHIGVFPDPSAPIRTVWMRCLRQSFLPHPPAVYPEELVLAQAILHHFPETPGRWCLYAFDPSHIIHVDAPFGLNQAIPTKRVAWACAALLTHHMVWNRPRGDALVRGRSYHIVVPHSAHDRMALRRAHPDLSLVFGPPPFRDP